MQVIDNGSIYFYDKEDECPHLPEEDELWQESFVLFFWDIEKKVYVFLRISQRPNLNTGYTTVWLNAWTPEYMYKHTNNTFPLGGNDINRNSLTAHHGLCCYEYNGTHNWQVNDKEHDVSITLVMTDAHQGLGYYADASSEFVSQTTKNHIEATGSVTGTVTIKNKTYTVAGSGWRDHSWGKRNWQGIRAHRFYPAMFGKEFNVFCISYIGEDGNLTKNGIIIRNEQVHFTNDFEIVAYIGEDGISNCGGKVTLELDNETHVLNFEPIGKSAISYIDGFPCVDGLCLVTMGDKVGVGISETSNNAQGGTDKPFIFPSSHGVIESGLFPV